jgi:hypothetical protein
VPGSARMIASIGDERNALLMLTVEADLGAGKATLPAARLYLLDENGQDQDRAGHLLRRSGLTTRRGRGGTAPARRSSASPGPRITKTGPPRFHRGCAAIGQHLGWGKGIPKWPIWASLAIPAPDNLRAKIRQGGRHGRLGVQLLCSLCVASVIHPAAGRRHSATGAPPRAWPAPGAAAARLQTAPNCATARSIRAVHRADRAWRMMPADSARISHAPGVGPTGPTRCAGGKSHPAKASQPHLCKCQRSGERNVLPGQGAPNPAWRAVSAGRASSPAQCRSQLPARGQAHRAAALLYFAAVQGP